MPVPSHRGMRYTPGRTGENQSEAGGGTTTTTHTYTHTVHESEGEKEKKKKNTHIEKKSMFLYSLKKKSGKEVVVAVAAVERPEARNK